MSASAAAPALVKETRRNVAIRLADPAVALAYVSLVFGALLIFFPVSFPRIIVENWQNAHLTPIMILFTVSVNVGLYLKAAHQRSAKPGRVAAACLGSVPVFVLVGLSFLLQAAIAHTLSGTIPNAQARIAEEILAHTYFASIAAIFAPFLLIRFGQTMQKTSSDA